ncbi:MAG: heme o synthase [Phycisphaerae bacterium]
MNSPLEQRDGSMPSGAVSSGLFSQPPGVESVSDARSRFADFCDLAKVRLSLLVLLVTASGFCLAADGPVDILFLCHTVLGTAMVAFAANALNQVLERKYDRLMCRTADRPLPAGRMSPAEALAAALSLAAAGLVYLSTLVNLLSAVLAGLTLLLYVLAYTPLKRRTPLNTLVGAIPGAIPPMIGYAAVRGELDLAAWLLFVILFVWQLPHFFAIAWLYREDYARAGYRMLSVVDPTGNSTARQTLGYTGLLLLVSFLPTLMGLAGPGYLAAAAILGVGLLIVALRFAAARTRAAARFMLLATIAYLPLLMAFMMLDWIPG